MTQNKPSIIIPRVFPGTARQGGCGGSPTGKTLLAYVALGIGIFSLSFSAMFVRWANAPGPVTAFYRLFFFIFLLLPFFPATPKNKSINQVMVHHFSPDGWRFHCL
jgi:hypothetical protein